MSHSTPGSLQRSSVKRQAVEGISKIIGNLSPMMRSRILSEALLHVGTCGEYEISRLVAKNLGVPEKVVDAVVLASYMEERSRRAALETGIAAAVEMSRQAGIDVWQEIRGAA
jgi:hypothetical protein